MLTVEFTVAGIPCIGLDAGPRSQHNEAFSFRSPLTISNETRPLLEVAIVGDGGQEMPVRLVQRQVRASPGRITPRVLTGGAGALVAMKQMRAFALR